MNQLITGLITLSLSLSGNPSLPADFAVETPIIRQIVDEKVLDLTIRPEGFGENILIAIRRLGGIKEDSSTAFTLNKVNVLGMTIETGFALLPGQVFAFHPNVLPDFKQANGQSFFKKSAVGKNGDRIFFKNRNGQQNVFGKYWFRSD